MTEAQLPEEPAGPSGFRARPNDWWGMLLVVATEATLFAVLLASYFYIRFHSGTDWPPGEEKDPELVVPGIMTAVILVSSVPMLWAERGIRNGAQARLRLGLALSFLLGALFLVVQGYEYALELEQTVPQDDAYASLFYTITGLHGLHLIPGLMLSVWTQFHAWRGAYTRFRHVGVQTTALYWHFVVAVQLFIFASLYLSPRV